MNARFRSQSRSRPTGRVNLRCPDASRIDRGYEAWRPALIAFYEKDEAPTKARLLKQGQEFDNLDIRTIKALQAAFICQAVAA